MDIRLNCTNTDDPEFINLLEQAISGIVTDSLSNELYVISVDRWFDYKWSKFSGIGVVKFEPLGIPGHDFDAALSEFSQSKTTFPPFTPNRIIKERFFCRAD